MKIIRKVLIIVTLFSLFSCESEETKLNKAKEVVKLFASSTAFDDKEKMYLHYPNIKEIKGRYLVLRNFEIIEASLNDNIVSVIGKSQGREIFFDVKKESGKYIIIRSKGLSMFFNSNLYKYCLQIGCIKEGDYDAEISKICNDKEPDFYILVESIKYIIEKSVGLENHTVREGYLNDISGDITYRNYSNYTIPSGTYNLYVKYMDKNENILFKNKEYVRSTLAYGQSNTIWVSEDVRRATKIAISLEIINTEFIERIIAEHAKGNNCIYSNNL